MRNFIYILIILCLSACKPSAQSEQKPTITVTLAPLRYFTEAIAGNQYEIVSMVPKGSSPETYDPTPQQLVALNKSQAYFRIGHIGFEQTWMDRLASNSPQLKFFDTSEGIDLIRTAGHQHGDHYHAGGVEPHVWNSANNAIILAENIYQTLCKLDSPNQTYYKERLDSLKRTIQETDKTIRELLQKADQTFLIYHPALSYFARDYGLKQVSIEEEGKEPSPAQLKTLIETCRKENIHVIFVQQEFDVRNAQLIADELGVTIIPINPLSYDWPTEMINVAKALTPKE